MCLSWCRRVNVHNLAVMHVGTVWLGVNKKVNTNMLGGLHPHYFLTLWNDVQAKWHFRMKWFYFFHWLFVNCPLHWKGELLIRHIWWQEKLNIACSAGLGIASILIALLVRVLFTFVCVLCAGFTTKEKAFIALAWMPKATVQVCAHSFNVVLLDCLQWV